MAEKTILEHVVDDTVKTLDQAAQKRRFRFTARETGRITFVGAGIARVSGLPNTRSEELLALPGGRYGTAFSLHPDGSIDVMLLDSRQGLRAGQEVARTSQVLSVPVGEALLGRVIDPLGRPLDDAGRIDADEYRNSEQAAPAIMDRLPVTQPLQTGIQVIDALIPIGRGQRELILGDRQTGKTAIVLDTIINQRTTDLICIYCAVGKRSSAVADVVSDLKKHEVMEKCIVVSATEADPPGLNYLAPYAAMTMGEFFRDRGDDVLVVIDDLTRHARSYRELSLLFRRPPAREAYPGDIFYIHSRLLERATHLKEELGGGSLTALPIIETQAQNLSAYIPTNLISITDGQIYLSPDLFRAGQLPAVDVGSSVSRVGGKTQLPAYRSVAGDLKLSYTQFEELENFARFGVRLDEDTQKTLERGRRVREVLKQRQYAPVPVPEQIFVLLSVSRGLLDEVDVDDIAAVKEKIHRLADDALSETAAKIEEGEELSSDEYDAILETIQAEIKEMSGEAQEENKGSDADAE
jgi:F-type H+-transporting ATPase subunit alpha